MSVVAGNWLVIGPFGALSAGTLNVLVGWFFGAYLVL